MEKEISKEIKLNLIDENGKYNFLGYKISYLNIENYVEKAWDSINNYHCESSFDSLIFRWDIFKEYFNLSISDVDFGSRIHNYQYMYLIVPNDDRLSCIPVSKYKHYINTFHWSCGVSISGKSWFHGVKATPNKKEFVIINNEYDNNGTVIIGSDDWVTHWYLIQHMYLAYKKMIKENSGEYGKNFLVEQLEKLLTYAEIMRNPDFSKDIGFFDCGSKSKVELCVGYYRIGYLEIPVYDDEDLLTLLETGVASKGIEYDFQEVKERLESFIEEKFKNKR